MPDAPKRPVTVGMLHVVTGRYLGEVDGTRPATVADLVSALRAEGVLVVEKVGGTWPEWAQDILWERDAGEIAPSPSDLFDALAEAQP